MCLEKLCANQDEIMRYRCCLLKRRCYVFCLVIVLSSIFLGLGMASLAVGVKRNKKIKGKGKELMIIGTLFGILGLLTAGSATVYILSYAFVTVTQDRWPSSKQFEFVKKRFGL